MVRIILRGINSSHPALGKLFHYFRYEVCNSDSFQLIALNDISLFTYLCIEKFPVAFLQLSDLPNKVVQ